MCTAVSYKTKDHYFGRNLDFEFSYQETITITPHNYPFVFRNGKEIKNHYAMIGMAFVVNEYPLYYEAVNDKGLGMAGLLFAGNAVYSEEKKTDKDNVASFEFIPWVLCQCADVKEAKELLKNLHLTNEAFSKELPPSPLHWMLSDKEDTIIVEAVKEGLKIYDNPVKVLTNNPPFDYQMMNLNNYMHLSADVPINYFSKNVELKPYSRGMGAVGLPGDLSSVSRFVKAAFTRMNAVSGDSEEESVSQFFHILYSVYQQRGCVRMPLKESTGAKQEYEITIYSCCCNTDRGIYYYTTYENQQIMCLDMHKEDLESTKLISYPMMQKTQFCYQN